MEYLEQVHQSCMLLYAKKHVGTQVSDVSFIFKWNVGISDAYVGLLGSLLSRWPCDFRKCF